MSARSYLSIGDVLTLLRQEFPDVTISKIRFLESQGLVNPERTPSGYRKFYEHDVERLRWVLRQQREHFLPLKVIKDRLDDGGDPSTEDTATESDSVVADTAESEDAISDSEPVLVGQRSWPDHATVAPEAGSTSSGMRGAPAAGHSAGSTLPGIEPVVAEANGSSIPAVSAAARGVPSPSVAKAADRTMAVPTSPTRSPPDLPAGGMPSGAATAPEVSATVPKDPSGSVRRTRTQAGEPPDRGPTSQAAVGAGSDSAQGGPDRGTDEPPGTTSAHEPPTAPPVRPGGRSGAPAAVRGSSPAPVAGRAAAGASLSLEDLASASGLDVSVLEDLVEYGLMVGTMVAGLSYFDEEALAVATFAAGFARYGIEPRHLRLYKNAADREAGFVEQIVLPLVRQRNPEARARANETADELTRLGQQLRASLLRSALGGLLNG